ncbi:uncharacterized protein TRIVIDRAFT_91392 [Trichoderma virens Gv29-8]|jgi:NAD(P)-dependent dehydrogenase (short-subunit alcohol dehydrogenase family)|uniref:Uncharacterized protein n=1 Tax=Hypocrea virens (strain Gv29-8 / FGSC 10586) TaxID=413071 RepID=G9MTX1_HYPVG|nr:uncharacterized protein TRIVIDRAFT_91392 [Trichoderma virens Gv29-8]EHK22108.1 hypothetical protein TRIVIDRAFT_91392 [Trichoderma virens Gv29-8]UKZ55859.1 hypothetical protein TrVGV298_009683 [Trichoderma virens]UKZ81617.1 hypothetical protein TrVFT333_009389 [Trichoderma virens FT-333]
MSSYLVTGASRGLGLEMVRVLASKPASEVSIIIATIRSAAPAALQEIISQAQGRVVTVQLEVTDPANVTKVAGEVKEILGGRGLDVLINNVAVSNTTPTSVTATTTLLSTFDVNVVAVQNLTLALLPLLREGTLKTVLNMGSIVGSITYAKRFMVAPDPAYRVSKAALHCLTRLYALELEAEGFTFVAVSPGWVQTDQGGPYADLDSPTAAKATLDVLSRNREDINGKLVNIKVEGWENATGLHKYDGGDLDW